MTARLVRGAILLAAPFLIAAAEVADPFDRVVADVKSAMLAEPARALRIADDAQRVADAEPDVAKRPLKRATAQWLRGEANMRLGAAETAMPLLANARRIATEAAPGSLLLADVLLAQGGALIDAGHTGEALATLQRAHDLFLALNQPRSRAKALILLALLYDYGRDHESALRYFRQAEEAYRGDQGLLLSIYSGRGVAFDNMGRFAEAEADFRRGLAVARQLRSDAAIAQLTGNIGKAQLGSGQVGEAVRTLASAMRLLARPEAAPFRPQIMALYASAEASAGQLARAEALIDERFRGVDLDTTIVNDRDAHEAAYRIYRAAGQDALALRHLAALKRLDDQSTEIARSTGAALMAARFDYANQELRIAKLKADDLSKSVAFERAAARTQRSMFVGVTLATVFVIALLGVGLFTIRRSRNEVRAANDGLETTNAKLEKALAAKTEFLATTSHEIRTPLNGILGMTQVMIADPALDPSLRERLNVVESAGTTMRALIDDILDVAKIETGKMTIERAPMDVVATVRDAARIWRDQARAKKLGFDIDLPQAPLWVMGDAARLRQIVFNLLSNAVKFTPAGGISLALTHDGDRLHLTVADTGIGICPEAHDIIFESFRQADAGTTRQFGGTGLGLSICRNLARGMGGDVTVASLPGEGATFTLDVPLELAEAPDALVERGGLLIVERNPITRATLKAVFSDFAPVAFAGDAAEALTAAQAQGPDRILADLATLGDAAGEALAALGEYAPLVLLVPAGENGAWAGRGATIVLERPIGRAKLIEAVDGLCPVLVPRAA